MAGNSLGPAGTSAPRSTREVLALVLVAFGFGVLWSRRSRVRAPVASDAPPAPVLESPLAVQSLNAAVMRARSVEIFTGAYVTLLSIVQATALGLLAVKSSEQLKARGNQAALATESIAVLLAIVLVFYMYVWFVLLVRWTPTILDTLIPFGLGTAEIAATESIGDHRTWVLRMAVLGAVGALGFWHSGWRATQDLFDSPEDYSRIHKLLFRLLEVTLAIVLFAVLAYSLLDRGISIAHHDLALSAATSASVVACATVVAECVLILWSEATLQRLFHRSGLRYLRTPSPPVPSD
jgi:hypothetical protein